MFEYEGIKYISVTDLSLLLSVKNPIFATSPRVKMAPWRNCIAHWISAPAVVG
jgi:hypothetical protein